MLTHGMTCVFSPAMDRLCDHIHSSLLSRRATKFSKCLEHTSRANIHAVHNLFSCPSMHSACENPLAIALLFQTGSHARCCCIQFLTSIATGLLPKGIICAWDHSMLRLTWRPLPFVANLAHCLYAAQRAHCQPSHLLACVPASAVLSLSVLHPAHKKEPTLNQLWQAGRQTDRHTHTCMHAHIHTEAGKQTTAEVRKMHKRSGKQAGIQTDK